MKKGLLSKETSTEITIYLIDVFRVNQEMDEWWGGGGGGDDDGVVGELKKNGDHEK